MFACPFISPPRLILLTGPSIPRQFRQSEWTDALAKYNTANSSPEALGAFMKVQICLSPSTSG